MTSDKLYNRIGQFLEDHRLVPDPAHYAFVHAILTQPNSSLAKAAAELIDGGVRLHQDDIQRLGGPAAGQRPMHREEPVAPSEPPPRDHLVDPAETRTDALAEQTQGHVEALSAMIRTIHADTSAFSANLERSAAEIRRGEPIGLATLAKLTGEMLERIHDSERRLEKATAEADALREKLVEARASARRDPLTGLANRLAFNESIGQCFQAPQSCCLALCDVDRFKRINDQHGHAVGDRVLNAIGQILSEEGHGHLVCRHGGEEFAILMTGVTMAQAHKLIDRAREAVREKRLRVRETGESIGEVTFSAGLTGFRPDDTHETVFARADALLYRAKNEGRNRICRD
ncbi:GGDEF domain-containing protein [Sphingomonas sp.]|uniref:GGDEF domain-containing protein n=1 Tax=Sphingomonas sp. TaxID=28214 RepID=UPI00289908BA|nr:GGDEF domain-containing protein [Sphingomonas sp.]